MIKLSFVGDIMCEPLMLKASKQGERYDFSGVFCNVKELLSESDYVIGNLETPLAGIESKYTHELFSFNAPDEFAEAIKDAGINYVSTATNHCMDRGIEGLKRTINVLDNIGLSHDGTHEDYGEHEPFITTIGDMSVAIISFTYGTNYAVHHRALPEKGYVDLLHSDTDPVYLVKKAGKKSWVKKLLLKPLKTEHITAIKKSLGMTYNTPRQDDYLNEEEATPYFNNLKRKIEKARENADLVVFHPHMGGQFNPQPGKFSEYTVKKALEFGVDAIIASHPHIVQKAVVYGDVPVFYSVGNYSMSPNSVYLLHENLPEYGIIPHLYMRDRKIAKVTFSIIKMIEERNKLLTVFPIDRIVRGKSDTENIELENAVKKIYSTVTGKKLIADEIIKSEYLLYDNIHTRDC